MSFLCEDDVEHSMGAAAGLIHVGGRHSPDNRKPMHSGEWFDFYYIHKYVNLCFIWDKYYFPPVSIPSKLFAEVHTPLFKRLGVSKIFLKKCITFIQQGHIKFIKSDSYNVQVHLNKLECREKVNFFL